MGDVDALREKLGLPAVPVVTAGLTTAVGFFRSALHQHPLEWWEYFRGIDFHKPVQVKKVPKGTVLVRYESTGSRRLKPFWYFTDPGTSPFRLGISFPAHEFKLFETSRETLALVSTASGLSFGPTDRVSRLGGGTQYIIAFADAPSLVRVAEPQRHA